MNTCDTCKWWTPRCSCCETYFGKVCANQKVSGRTPKSDSDNMILHGKKSDWAALNACHPDVFYTGPKFGCIHHEPA